MELLGQHLALRRRRLGEQVLVQHPAVLAVVPPRRLHHAGRVLALRLGHFLETREQVLVDEDALLDGRTVERRDLDVRAAELLHLGELALAVVHVLLNARVHPAPGL